MTTYTLPPQPAGPVWDRYDQKWENTGNGIWTREECGVIYHDSWELLLSNSPLYDTPPIEPGRTITNIAEEAERIPPGTVLHAPNGIAITRGEDCWWFGDHTATWMPVNLTDLPATPFTVAHLECSSEKEANK